MLVVLGWMLVFVLFVYFVLPLLIALFLSIVYCVLIIIEWIKE